MRFGIMAMQLDALLPSGVPAEKILEGIRTFDYGGLVQGLAAQGFNPIELGGDLGMFLPRSTALNRSKNWLPSGQRG